MVVNWLSVGGMPQHVHRTSWQTLGDIYISFRCPKKSDHQQKQIIQTDFIQKVTKQVNNNIPMKEVKESTRVVIFCCLHCPIFHTQIKYETKRKKRCGLHSRDNFISFFPIWMPFVSLSCG